MAIQKPAQQLALDMFSAFADSDLRVAESPTDFGFQKADALIAVTDLSLVSRRSINALHFIACENPTKRVWDVDVGYFKWLANFVGSRNDKHLTLALRECQQAAIQVSVLDAEDSNKDVYASVPLLGTFVMSGGRLSFKLPDEITRLLQAPTNAKYLSLRIGASFSSGYALTLYERILRFRDIGETGWHAIEEVKAWFGASDKKSLQEYKIFKRDVLKPALEQVNQISDLLVSLEERREKRRVTKVNFLITANPNFAQKLPPEEAAMRALYQTLSEEFGLSSKDFDEIMDNRSTYTNQRIEQTIELVKFRRSRLEIKRPSAYFMKMLREGVVLSNTEKMGIDQQEAKTTRAAKAKAEVSDATKAASRNQATMLEKGRSIWNSLSDDQRAEAWEKYVRSLPGKTALKKAGLTLDVMPQIALEHSVVACGFFATLSEGSSIVAPRSALIWLHP